MACGLGLPAGAAVSPEAAAALKSRLTPVGAERTGDPALGIPDWTGALEASPAERPLFSITATNVGDYADRLPEGQKALFARFADYRMDIYPTHRSAVLPPSVYDATLANATRAQAAPDGIGRGIAGAAGGIPFPIPGNGAEAMWNHILAYWGPARDDRLRTYVMSADGVLDISNQYREIVDFPYYYPGVDPGSVGPYYFKRREVSDGPPALAGRGYLDWRPLDAGHDEFQVWQYLPGQHRVRRSPALAYDAPTPDGAGIESFDEYYLFSGSLDRYIFTLLGKRPLYVPYNNNRFHALPASAVARPGHIDPDALRWELHRVWVVDAVLAPGQHHLAPHRRFYLDEDTWFAVYAESWDEDGRLWKFGHATMYMMPELPAVVQGSTILYDLENGGYVLAFAFNGGALVATQPHAASVFEPETLATEGVR
jgi:hypothetical protein